MFTVRAAAVIVLTLGVVLLGGCTGAEARRQSYIERGQEYFAKGDYSRATVEFRNAMQVMPKDPQARILAGEAVERMGRYREAAGLFQSVIESNPENVRARVDLGQMYCFGHVPLQALKLIVPALAKHPDNAQLLTVRALARSELKDYADALADAQRAVQVDPTYVQAVGLLAGLYEQKNENDQAASLVQSALQKLPKSTQLREVLVSIYAQAGDNGRTEEQLRELIAMRPANLRYRAQLAQVEVAENHLDQAEAVLRAAVQTVPQGDDAKLLLVYFLRDHRSAAQGEAALRSFIAAAPDDYGLRFALGTALENGGQADQALSTYGAIAQQDGDGPNALIARDRMAAIYISEGRNDEAAAEVGQVLERDSGNDAALMIRGNLELASGHPTAAMTDLRAVARDEPGLIAVHRLLARALLANGSTALAEEELQTAIQIAPGDAGMRLELAQMYLQAGDAERSIAVLEQGVQQLPTNGPLRGALVRAYIAKGDLASATRQADSISAALPHSGAGPYLEGLIAVAQKQYVPAETDFEQALQRQPRAVAPLLDLVHLELSQHETSKAAERLRRIVQSDPTDGLAQEMLGEVDLSQKSYPRAIAELSQAIKLAPSLWYAYRNLAIAEGGTGDTAGALAAYQAGIKAVPGQPELVTELASYYVRQGQPNNAIALFEALYQRQPTSPTAASNLALLLATYKSDQPSLVRAQQLSAPFANSNDGALLDASGWVLLKSGHLDRALPVLQRAESRDPTSDLIRYHVAMAELQAGERAKGQADLKAALSGSPSFPGVTEARSALASLQPGAG
jgi:tetratricopeptide (TPR) repeat protein